MSSEVKRYDPINSDGTCGICVEDADYGAYVEYADYAALEAECERLRHDLIQTSRGHASTIAERDALAAELEAIKRQDVRGDARGKQCPHCGGPMVSLSSMSLRICADCRRSLDWHLEPGQQPLLANNRLCPKQDEHNKEQADGHDN